MISQRIKEVLKARVIEPWREWRYCKKHGVTPEIYRYRQFLETKINPRARTVKEYFYNFKYIIEVDYNKLSFCPFSGAITNSIYNEVLENNAAIRYLRVSFYPNECPPPDAALLDDCFGGDRIYVACDDEKYAILVAMRWSA